MSSPARRARILSLVSLLLVFGLMVDGWSQSPGPRAKAEVSAVRFNVVNAPESTLRWFEADVELDVRSPGGRITFVDRVKITFALGIKSLDGTYRFYRSEAEAISLEVGPAHFRFYLPPEVVRRDGLRPDVEFWLAEISIAGEAQPNSPRSYSPSLREAERLANFQNKVVAEAPARAGELLPQHHTPFAAHYRGATPTMLRPSRQ